MPFSVPRQKPQDDLLPLFPRYYPDFMREISSEELYEGLLGWGLFADKLPPMFTSEPFMQYCKTRNGAFADQRANWIRFSYMRNINKKRLFGIPTPFAYERLVRCLSNNWNSLVKLFTDNTSQHPYRVSRIHIRHRKGTKSLFLMNYKNWRIDEDPLPALMVGSQFVIECDISQCFPSIYTHAIDWAILGKDQAKKNSHGKVCCWSHNIDHFAMNITNGETHGLLIGPHASNLLAEIILTRIDNSLFENGFRFIRHIDDYVCYTDSEADAHNFVIELETQLAQYGLSINQKKTSLRKLPTTKEEDWIRALSAFQPNRSNCKKNDVVQLLDAAVSAMEHSKGDVSTLNYAFKMLSKCTMNYWAKKYYSEMALHFAYIFPYLLPIIEQHVFEAAKTSDRDIAIFSNLVFEKALKERDYLSACYALYYAIRYKFTMDSLREKSTEKLIFESNDCMLLVCALVYSQYKDDGNFENQLKKYAKNLATDENDFFSNWLFVYEALDANELPEDPHKGAWKEIKRAGLSFIDRSSIERPFLNEVFFAEKGAAVKDLLSNSDEDTEIEESENPPNEL